MLEETGQRGVEGPVARPEARKRQDALATQLLDDAALGEDDGQDVPERRQGDEDGEGALGGPTKDVTEEKGGDETARAEDIFLGHGGEIGHVDEHVDDGDGDHGDGEGDLEGPDGVLGLAQGVVGVAVADVRPDDVVERDDDAVARGGGAVEGVVEVVEVVGDLEVAAQGDEAGEDDEGEDGQLDAAEEVLQVEAPPEGGAVDEEGDGDAGEADGALVPAVDLDLGGVQDVLAEDDGVAGGPGKEDDVAGVQAGDEEAGLAVDELEVVLLAAVFGDGGSEFEVDGAAGEGDEHAGYPHEEGQTDGAREAEDAGRGGEYAGTDDAVED